MLQDLLRKKHYRTQALNSPDKTGNSTIQEDNSPVKEQNPYFYENSLTIMKRLLFSLALLFSTFSGFSQTTITGSIIPSIGHMFINVEDTLAIGVTAPTMGPNMNWDFTNFSQTGMLTYTFIDPTLALGGDSFPSAEIAVDRGDSLITFLDSSSIGLKIIGVYIYRDGIDTMGKTMPNEITLPTPFNYQDSIYDYSGTLVQGIYTGWPAKLTTERWKNMVAKGWGTVSTPAGFYQNVVCIESRVLRRDTVKVNFGSGFVPFQITADTSIFYDFYDTNVGAVMSFEVDSISDTVTTYSYTYRTWPVGVSEQTEAAQNGLLVSPNPASESAMLTLRTPAKKGDMVRVTDLSGRIVKEFGLEGNGNYSNISFSVTELTNGTYLVSVSGSVMLQSKLVVNKR